MTAPVRKVRCAVYTRKSSEEGLEQEFNSLHAQREACEAYVKSQKAEGWLLVTDRYDDGGYSGGTLERPALKRLLADIEGGAVDVVVVYKIDRLSRSLMDFSRLVSVFEQHDVTFVSVTQSFNTTTSMGRLTLNILLSFAQFERELISERIRDKIAASRRKGIWMGGFPPLGYDVKDRKLVVNEVEARAVEMIFNRFLKLGSATALVKELAAKGVTTKGGKPLDKGAVYKLLKRRVYIGEAVHKGESYPGEHQAIIQRNIWERVHAVLATNGKSRGNRTRAQTPALLKGLIFGPSGRAMTPTHTRKKGRLYRYYISTDVLRGRDQDCPVRRLPAAEVEQAVIDQLRTVFRSPEVVVRTWKTANKTQPVSERAVTKALQELDPLWGELFPAEQADRPAAGRTRRRCLGQHQGPHPRRWAWEPRRRAAAQRRDEAEGGMSATAVLDRDGRTITVTIPLRIRQRGGRRLVLVPEGAAPASAARPDSTLVKAVVRAHRWQRMLEQGDYSSIAELARAERITKSYLCRIFRLTSLAPDIIEAILDGRGKELQLSILMGPFPIDWNQQRQRLLGSRP
jgi:DNA invertase Pin-like site-specific DNA recombinase